jgi:hypothetical protein
MEKARAHQVPGSQAAAYRNCHNMRVRLLSKYRKYKGPVESGHPR